MANSRIMVTGGAGFVGSFIVDRLLEQGAGEIIILDNFVRGSKDNITQALQSNKVKLVEGDIRDAELLNRLMGGVDYCFHMAALRITHCAANPREAVEVMCNGTFNVIDCCLANHVKKLIAASSASVYGQADIFPTREDHHPYSNRTLYGALKLANELMLRSFNDMSGLNYNAFRYFNIYGPRMDVHGKYTEVLIRWYHAIKEGKRPLIYGDGKQTMDFVYVEDVARASILGLTADVSDQVFNIGSGTETSLEELCLLLLEVMRVDLVPEYIPVPETRKKVEVRKRIAHISKAKELLKFEAAVELTAGLHKLVEWLDLLTAKTVEKT
ncbi:MAG: NAD-dependent epimerase/dehydratase family protein [Candidatus Omnitrophota bacterium]|nr:NAD-dependent epimerase/dehydratase family protein [Candidatus Omnitrophota bacterium]